MPAKLFIHFEPWLASCPWCDFHTTGKTAEAAAADLVNHARFAHQKTHREFWLNDARAYVDETRTEREMENAKEKDDSTGELFGVTSLGRAG